MLKIFRRHRDLKVILPIGMNVTWFVCPSVCHVFADIRWKIATERLEIAQWSQWTACMKPTSLFQLVPSLTIR